MKRPNVVSNDEEKDLTVPMNRPGLLRYNFISTRLKRARSFDHKVRRQAALVQSLQQRAIHEMRELKLMLAQKGGAA